MNRKLLFIVALLVISASAQKLPAKLVSTEWLATNLAKENLRIIDVRNDIRDYWQGHIPGAMYFSSDAMRLADHGVPGMLTPPEALVIMLGKMGINRETMVVVYTEQGDYKAAYLIWALDYIGHVHSAIVEGGFEKWRKEENAITQDYPKIIPVKYELPLTLNHKVRATLEEVKKVVKDGSAVLLDVRPAQLYTGEKGMWKRKGHIKRAVNHFWGDDLKEDGTWKDTEALRSAYKKLGATPDKLIIVSCGQGLMSAHAYFTLRYVLGYANVKNYDGSFNEWSNIDELPVETGSK